ncbi:hypothetical protein HDV00_008295 [Rhizophlyctis rosea]|nr:hypothetical protein HDV00_008295 [Rhizophlyctis rosea]
MRKFTILACTALLASSAYADSYTKPEPSPPTNILTYNGRKYSCKCYEGDACWPKAAKWTSLNSTVEGALERVVPDLAVCFKEFEGKSYYDADKCKIETDLWANQFYQVNKTVENLWTYWTNTTCVPPTNPNITNTCTLGYLPRYVIKATKPQHIKAGVDFARQNNVRLVIRNTGHDFMGRSAGYGSLAINTHNFKSIKFVRKYSGPGNWKGGAVTVGAGVEVKEVYDAAFRQSPPVVVVGGECASVGLAGGYIQGGGHGPLATIYGMAADSALSFDIITADGRYVTANELQNPSLFWALKGGGPSTFGVVVSVTLKTHPEVPTAGLILNINSTHTTNTTLIWSAIRAFHNRANLWVDNGMFVYYEIFPGSLHVQPFVGPNMTRDKILKVTKPLFDDLDRQGIPYTKLAKEYKTFYELYIDMFEFEHAGDSSLVGGRLFTKKDIALHGDDIVDAYRKIVEPDAGSYMNFGFLIGHIVGPGVGVPKADNAVNEKWREASSFTITNVLVPNGAGWAEKAVAQKYLTDIVDGGLRKASPYGAAYVNEGNLEEPNWQNAYWGDKYSRLYAIRKKWDPTGVFYTRTTPGTEGWEVIDYGSRLCKRV